MYIFFNEDFDKKSSKLNIYKSLPPRYNNYAVGGTNSTASRTIDVRGQRNVKLMISTRKNRLCCAILFVNGISFKCKIFSELFTFSCLYVRIYTDYIASTTLTEVHYGKLERNKEQRGKSR